MMTGVAKVRRTFRRIDELTGNGIRLALLDVAEAIKQDAISNVGRSSRTGDLARSIDKKVSSDGLSAIIGPGARAVAILKKKALSPFATRSTEIKLSATSKDLLLQFFKGYWLERGTKGSPERNIPPQSARPFMQPAFDVNKRWGIDKIKSAVNSALKEAAQ